MSYNLYIIVENPQESKAMYVKIKFDSNVEEYTKEGIGSTELTDPTTMILKVKSWKQALLWIRYYTLQNNTTINGNIPKVIDYALYSTTDFYPFSKIH